jgi:hypothetical protein
MAFAFLAPILLLGGFIDGHMYQEFGQQLLYTGIAFMALASGMVVISMWRGEF